MSHEHEYVSNTGKIWKVFGILSLVTIIEVILGILKPESLHFTDFHGDEFALIFYALTVYKAYYIVYSFMHMEVKSALRYAVVLPVIFLIIFTIHSLTEGNYI
jgi:cytochrome c oxidase subunit IV